MEHNHSQGLSHQHPGHEGEKQGWSWTGVALKSSTLCECCPMQCQYRGLCWCLLLVRDKLLDQDKPLGQDKLLGQERLLDQDKHLGQEKLLDQDKPRGQDKPLDQNKPLG